MAPERTGQGSVANTAQLVKRDAAPALPKATSILEDFLEIKIKEELDYKELKQEVVEEGEVVGEVLYPGRKVRGSKREEDQDLTSLSWLQSNNLLKSKRKYSSRLLLSIVFL